MICNEAIVLAGGFGTRLKSVVSDIPKPMAVVAGKPFLFYVLNFLQTQGIQRTVLSVGYKHEVVSDFFGSSFEGMELIYAIESEPLGTGGAVKFASEKIHSDRYFLLNGDSFFNVNIKELLDFHCNSNSSISLSLKKMHDFDRYGVVEFYEDGKVTAFKEKQYRDIGFINGGVYVVEKSAVSSVQKQIFSFEKDVLEVGVRQNSIFGKVFDGYFIDIGIPEDFVKASDFEHELLNNQH